MNKVVKKRHWEISYAKQTKQITKSLSYIERTRVDEVISLLKNNYNNLFFTGIGKNGHVAAKSSSTFSSMGVSSFFIDPIEALHGSMSLISDGDVLIAISKSGNTPELIAFLKRIKEYKNINLVLVHSNENSACKLLSDLDIFVPIEDEADKFNIIPISSIAVFTILLQSIGVELSYCNNLTKQQFIKNHPGGAIGQIKQ